jgi:glycosyltransferase involved in cell wall biosynthesis
VSIERQPLVSILIPVYNAAPYVAVTLDSALGQTYPNIEIIAVDDGSMDGSVEVLKRYDGRIAWSRQANAGQAVSRNRLLAASRGAYLLFLDADDIIAADKVSRQVEKMEAQPEADICLDDMRLFYSSIDEDCPLFPCPVDEDPWVALIALKYPFTSAGLWRRSALEALGGWREGRITGHEYDRYLRLLERNRKICFTTGGRTYYRMPSREKPNTRDPMVTLRERLSHLEEIEAHLRGIGGLTRERRLALAMARLQLARSMWRHDRAGARRVARRIANGDVAAELASPALPASYIRAYKTIGFAGAQLLAGLKAAARRRLEADRA